MLNKRYFTIFFLISCLTAASSLAVTTNEEIYLYKRPDRDKQLIEKAKQEGKVMLYSSIILTDSIAITRAFEKKYGIKVELWRGLADKVVQRTVSEARANRHTVDVIDTNSPELEMLAREKLLSEFYSPYLADLPPAAIPAHKQWVADRFNFWVAAYNTNKIKKEAVPKTYEDFLDPKWKGKIGLEATDTEWFATLVKIWGEEKGLAYFKKLAEMNPDIRKGHILLAELVSAGEIPLTLTAYNHHIEKLKNKGAPVEWMPIPPAIARPNGVAVAKFAPHPHAALLFADFLLSPEGQELFRSMDRVPSSLKVKTNLNNFKYVMVDPVVILDEWDKWDKLWEGLFLKK